MIGSLFPIDSRHLTWSSLLITVVLTLMGCGARDVRIEGNTVVADRELVAAAQRPLADWRQPEGRPADAHDAAFAMRSVLLDRGYPLADVEFRITDNRHLVFMVEPGPAIVLTQVDFPGRSALSAGELRGFFFERGLLAGTETPFVQRDVESALRLVERRYRNEGYLNVRAGPPDVQIIEQRAYVTVPIDEGLRFTVSRVTVTGSEETLAALGPFVNQSRHVGQPFRHLLAVEISARLRSALGAQGYLAPQVTTEDVMSPDTGAVELTFHVEPGAQVRLGEITVSGQQRTHPNFIRNRLRGLTPGEPIDAHAVDDGVRRLYSTGLFSQATITPQPTTEDGVADLAIAVSEASSRSVAMSVGWGSYEQLRGSVEWVDDNVFGRGLRFMARGRASLKGWGADTGVLERHHLGDGRSLGVDLRHDVREEPNFVRTETALSTTFRHEFYTRIDPTARWSYRTIYSLSFNDDDEVEGAIVGEEIARYRLSTITIGLQRDTRATKPVHPEAGTLLDGSIGWSTKDLGSEVPFVDHRIRWTHHRRLHRRLVGVVNAQVHTRDPLDSASLPIGERLFLGGDATVRSFTKDTLGPKDATGSPTGGLSASVANLEFRWVVWAQRPNFELAAFYDIGSLGAEPWSIEGPAGQAIGGGIRYVLPVGPIRIDGAWNPGETFGEDRYAFHLTVGFAF